MGLNKQRKAYLAVLGAAGLFFAVDRLFLDGGATGPAAVEASPQQAAAPPAPRAAGPRTENRSVSVVAARLQKAAAELGSGPGVDAFAGTPAWLASKLQPAVKAAQRDEVAEFERAHELSKVIRARSENSGGGVAVVDGKPVYVGKKVSDFVLIDVDPQKGLAVFEKDGKRAILRLVESPDAPPEGKAVEKSPR